jgi:YjjG family noncanonical pyrimidine nucleotidase
VHERGFSLPIFFNNQDFMNLSPSNIKAIVFDLDNTLIDHASAEAQAMERVLNSAMQNAALGEILRTAPDRFLAAYRINNERLWHDLAFERITSEELRWQRFAFTLGDIAPQLAKADAERLGKEMGEEYLQLYKHYWQLIKGANELLDALQNLFKLGVITNGFRDQQRGKLAKFGWEERFDAVVLSDEVGVMKPHKAIFAIAEERLGSSPEELVYVGDNYLSDIEGAKDAGWRAVWFNPAQSQREQNRADATISALDELQRLVRV